MRWLLIVIITQGIYTKFWGHSTAVKGSYHVGNPGA